MNFWWSTLGWPTWLVVLAVVVLVAAAVFLARRGSIFLALTSLLGATIILRMGFAVSVWNWLEWIALLCWLGGIIATGVYLVTHLAGNLARSLVLAAFGMVAAFDIWQYVLIPLWNYVLVPFGHWLVGNGWNWLVLLGIVVALVAIILLLRVLIVPGLLVLLLAAVLIGSGLLVPSGHNPPEAGPTRPESPATTQPKPQQHAEGTTLTKCPTWKMSTKTPKNGNWVHNGVRQIRTAQTRSQARHAANVWLDQVKRNTGTLSGAVSYFTNKTVTPSALVDKNGCATQRAVTLSQETAIALAMSSVKPAMAPVTARNSGTRGGNVFAYSVSGVGGDRHAVRVTIRKNGKVVKTIWILARCGNVASTGKPPVKTGKPPKGAPMPPKHHVPSALKCVKPKYVPANMWNYATCSKKPSSFDYGQNTGPQAQPVQENHNNVYTGPTSGTSSAPSNTQVHSGDSNTTKKGSNSGSTTGSGTAAGSTCDSSGCTSGSTSGSGDGGSGTGSTSGDTNDGSVDPFGP